MSYSSNLPPGVHEGMIPGNRPQDIALQMALDSQTEDDFLEFLYNHELDCAGCCIGERDEGGFYLESDEVTIPWEYDEVYSKDRSRVWYEIIFDTEEDAIAWAICFHYSEIDDALTEEISERMQDDYYGF